MSKSAFRGGRDNAAIIENVEKLTGQRGDGLDRAMTLRELHSLGLVSVSRGARGRLRVQPVSQPTRDGEYTNKPVSIPDAPSQFEAHGGFGAIMLEWSRPTYSGHGYTEIWRADVDDISAADIVATVTATVFGDIVSPGSTYFYWCRHININDKPGPYHDRSGLEASTSGELGNIIDDVSEQLQSSPLVTELSGAIATINEEGSQAYRDMWSYKAQIGDITAGIGILADSEGRSQVAVSASQFFVFDPNNGQAIAPAFAIDEGNVVIPKAMIERATIQILNAQTIVADEVKAGISLTSPKLKTSVIEGGQAGFGVGGPYGGYHTRISMDGSIETSRLFMRSNQSSSRLEINGDKLQAFNGNQLAVVLGKLE
ncbi:phage tail tip fiber protein [Salinivibrio kushneri]|uniref:Tip attachment protein J central straight fiber domain-containing protein n=1 Tax=Salinivibrio kushneri TaxID=1908198 RepID=A0AB36K597_9GAMM|nr:DUF1983 domain-containing protein [Salinivibrio kushneri]OOE43439.1 hypothetical protein BZG09_10690 [Salinivibrio kushneri]